MITENIVTCSFSVSDVSLKINTLYRIFKPKESECDKSVLIVPICKCICLCERNCTVFESHCWEMLSPYIDVKVGRC